MSYIRNGGRVMKKNRGLAEIQLSRLTLTLSQMLKQRSTDTDVVLCQKLRTSFVMRSGKRLDTLPVKEKLIVSSADNTNRESYCLLSLRVSRSP